MINNVCIIGAGNEGTMFASAFLQAGYCVKIYTSKPYLFSKRISSINEKDEVFLSGDISFVSDNPKDVIEGSELVIVTYPANLFSEAARIIEPYANDRMTILALPGTGGAEFAFKECMKKGCTLLGMQRVPYVCRLIKYGESVRAEGKRDRLKIASIPSSRVQEFAQILEKVFGIPCDILPEYLCVTMTPSNPILHTTRLATLFSDYKEGIYYEKNPLFYGEWTNESSKLLLACDSEHQYLCDVIDLDLSSVLSLKIHYGSDTVEGLTNKIKSIKSLHNLSSPMNNIEECFVPNFDSRYFTADFPYGLAIIQEIAKLFKVECPNIDKTMKWYIDVTGDDNHFRLSNYGVFTKEDFYSIYKV